MAAGRVSIIVPLWGYLTLFLYSAYPLSKMCKVEG